MRAPERSYARHPPLLVTRFNASGARACVQGDGSKRQARSITIIVSPGLGAICRQEAEAARRSTYTGQINLSDCGFLGRASWCGPVGVHTKLSERKRRSGSNSNGL